MNEIKDNIAMFVFVYVPFLLVIAAIFKFIDFLFWLCTHIRIVE